MSSFTKSYFLILLLVQACSWGSKDLSVDKKQDQVIEQFDLNPADKEKFKVTPITEIVSPTALPAKVLPLKQKKKVKIKETAKKFLYPKGYPPEYIQYDETSEKIWKMFNATFPETEEAIYQVSYIGLTVGKIAVRILPKVMVGNIKSFHFHAKLRSAPFFRAIYELDDSIESFLDEEKFIPLKYLLTQKESSQTVDDLQLFDFDQLKTFFHYKRTKKGVYKEEHTDAFIPRFVQDSFSALFFCRGLPMKEGDQYVLPVTTRSRLWQLSFQILAREKMNIMGQEVMAFKVKAITHYPGVLEKQGDALFWFSDTPERKLLKFQAKVKIGSFAGTLMEYHQGVSLTSSKSF